jgi:predicted DNA binding protein
MTVIVEITVPADSFILGKIFHKYSDAVIELEPIVPLQNDYGGSIPLVWISRTDPEADKKSLLETNYIERLTTADDKTLFEVEWSDEIDGIVQSLTNSGGRILKAIGTQDSWDFHLLFDSHESLSEFNMAATSKEIPITLRKLHNPSVKQDPTDSSSEDMSLPNNHRETLLRAYRNGYYDVPRRSQLAELAEQDDISGSALSKRLRRANAKLIELTLLSEEELADSSPK